MAENTGTYNANAVYGSLAYDFNNPALYPDYAEEASWQVSHQVHDIPAEEELPQVKTAAKNKQAISPLAVIGAAFASVLIVVMLLAQVSLTAVSNEAVELTEKEYLYVGLCLLLLAVKSCREYLCIVEYECVTLFKIIDDVLEKSVLDFACRLMKNHKFGFVAPSRRLCRYLLCRKIELEL